MQIIGGLSKGLFRKKFGPEAEERGTVDIFMLGMILFILIAIGLGIGFYYQYTQANQYRTSRESYANQVASKAVSAQKTKDNASQAEAVKQPFSTFTSPAMFGSVNFQYPRTWSQFVQSNSDNQFAAYFNPLYVPPIDDNTAYALRVIITNQAYSDVLQSFNNQVTQGNLTSTTLTTGVDDKAKGIELSGQFSDSISGEAAIFPIMSGNYTLEIFTDSQAFESDFANTVLPSLKYSL